MVAAAGFWRKWTVVAVVAVGAVAAYRGLGLGAAPVPEPFDKEVSLELALARSAQVGRPVLALATADWCGPCQVLKRGALRDEAVVEMIRSRFEPVYIDLTDTSDRESRWLGTRLRVRSIPAIIVLRDGEEVGRIEGAVSAARLSQWLEGFVAPATAQAMPAGG